MVTWFHTLKQTRQSQALGQWQVQFIKVSVVFMKYWQFETTFTALSLSSRHWMPDKKISSREWLDHLSRAPWGTTHSVLPWRGKDVNYSGHTTTALPEMNFYLSSIFSFKSASVCREESCMGLGAYVINARKWVLRSLLHQNYTQRMIFQVVDNFSHGWLHAGPALREGRQGGHAYKSDWKRVRLWRIFLQFCIFNMNSSVSVW